MHGLIETGGKDAWTDGERDDVTLCCILVGALATDYSSEGGSSLRRRENLDGYTL